jgi:hypothetical protein
LELLLIYIEVPVPNHQNTSSCFGNCSQSVVVFFFYILSQHLDHLQQLDNLEHSAHLYGQWIPFTQFYSTGVARVPTVVSGAFYYRLDV